MNHKPETVNIITDYSNFLIVYTYFIPHNKLTITTPLLQSCPSLMADELSTMRTNTNTSVTLSIIKVLTKRNPSQVVLVYTKIKTNLNMHQ